MCTQEVGQTGEESERGGFDWKRQWYPVAIMRDLEAMDPRKPYPVKVGEGVRAHYHAWTQ